MFGMRFNLVTFVGFVLVVSLSLLLDCYEDFNVVVHEGRRSKYTFLNSVVYVFILKSKKYP